MKKRAAKKLEKHSVLVTEGPRPAPVGDRLPAAESRVFRFEADPFLQFAVACELGYFAEYQALPHWSDDLTARIGSRWIEDMQTDAQVSSDIEDLKEGVLADEWQLAPAVAPKQPDYDEAKRISDFCEDALDGLATPIETTLYELLDGLARGNKAGEVVWRKVASGPDAGLATLSDIVVLSNESVAYVVDQRRNLLGLAYTGPQHPVLTGPNVSEDWVLPREKFCHFVWRPKNRDPRGTSILRAAYGAWFFKARIWPENHRWLTQSALPWVIGVLPAPPGGQSGAGATLEQAVNADGTPAKKADGSPLMVNRAWAMAKRLEGLKNHAVFVTDHGGEVKAIEVSGDGKQFEVAMAMADGQISKAILGVTLVTSEGKHNARAAAGTHKDVFDARVRRIKKLLAVMMRRDVLMPLVRWNFGEDAARRLTPLFHLGDVTQEDIAGAANGVAALLNTKQLAPNQRDFFIRKLGGPAADEDFDPDALDDPALEDPAADDELEQHDLPKPGTEPAPALRKVRSAAA